MENVVAQKYQTKYIRTNNNAYIFIVFISILLTAIIAITLHFVLNWIYMLVTILVGGILMAIALVLCKLIKKAKLTKNIPNDIIIKKDDVLSVYNGNNYINVNIKDITKIQYNDTTYTWSGKVTIPLKHEHGTITLFYTENNKKKYVRSVDVLTVIDVYKELNTYISL